MTDRCVTVQQNTLEAQTKVTLNLDGKGQHQFKTGLPFLEHMLVQLVRFSKIDLNIWTKGDLHIDAHHTVESVGTTFGQALAQTVGQNKTIRRFGYAYAPLDEALSRAVIDFASRPNLKFNVNFMQSRIGNFEVELFHVFFKGVVDHARITVHIDNICGQNSHHIIESIFKAFGCALRMAIELDARAQ